MSLKFKELFKDCRLLHVMLMVKIFGLETEVCGNILTQLFF